MTTKTCKTCGVVKLLEDFTQVKRNKDGRSGSCKSCDNAKKRSTDPDGTKSRERVRKFYAANPTKAREYYEKKKLSEDFYEKQYNSTKRYRQLNPGWMAAQCAKRRAVKKNATPMWQNEFFVQEAYELANLRTNLTGIEWHVDHIVPLQHRNACGLHTEDNLQIIPATLNYKKMNYTMDQYKWSDCFAD
ncbi:MAG: hypothetical protein VKL39_22080 [Leptolyngbyaceae bacterium]|nr:hypothetical protein [Leptolyngbyaceae bacterium]